MSLILDRVPVLSTVELTFHRSRNGAGAYVESAVFRGISGEGEERRATFLQTNARGVVFEWDAYRYGGRWAYGSGAQRLQLTGVTEYVQEQAA